jgi:AsmA protein
MNDPLDNTNPPPRRRRRGFWIAVSGLLLFVLLPVMTALVWISRFNPNAYAPALTQAVDQATGRQLTIGGRITVQYGVNPTLRATDLTLSNPPGYTDASLLTLQEVRARIALLPLLSHRIDILDLTLVKPQMVLERANGPASGWDFDFSGRPKGALPKGPKTAGASAPARTPPGQTRHPYRVAVQAVNVEQGLVTIKLPDAGAPQVFVIPRATGTAASLSVPLHIKAHATIGQTPFELSGTVGPIARLSGIGTGDWPLDLALQLGGATAQIRGSIAHPRRGAGYDLNVAAAIPAISPVLALLPPGWLGPFPVPPLQNLALHARIVDQHSRVPAIDDVSLEAGASDLSAVRPGLKLRTFSARMASLDQPVTLDGSGQSNGAEFSLHGSIGPLQALLPRAWLPASMPPQVNYPVALSARIGTATFGLQGAIATPETLAGAALALSASIPNLSELGKAVAIALPDWTHITLKTAIIDPGGLGLRKAIGLDDLSVSMDHAAFGGVVDLYRGANPRLDAALQASRIELDPLLAAWPAAPHTAAPAAASPAPNAVPRPATTQVPTQAPPQAPRLSSAIMLQKFPLDLLRRATANIEVSADTLVWNHATYAALQGHAVLANGVLKLAPLHAQLPGGSIDASASLDAGRSPAAGTFNLTAPALALGPLLQALGVTGTAQGTAQLQLHATGKGDDLRDLSAGVSGQLGLALVNGTVDGRVISELFGAILASVGLPAGDAGAQGPVPVRCLALRIDAAQGIGTVRALTLDSSRLLLQGGGKVDLASDTLALVLRPQMQVAGTEVSVPVQIKGSFAAPKVAVATANTLQAAAKDAGGLKISAAQLALGNSSVLGKAAALLGMAKQTDVCPAALALARLGEPGPAAPPMASALPGAKPDAAQPKDLLKALLGQ